MQKNNKKIIIYGNGDVAEIAHYYFKNDSAYNVEAFCVEGKLIKESLLLNCPVIPFEELNNSYSPKETDVFIAVGHIGVNEIRATKFNDFQKIGYRTPSYISSKALISNAIIGGNCFIMENVTIQAFASIRDNVTIYPNSFIGHHSLLNNHVFVSTGVSISGNVTVGEYSFIGTGATISDNIKIGNSNLLSAGCLITRDTHHDSVYIQEQTIKNKIPCSRLKKIAFNKVFNRS